MLFEKPKIVAKKSITLLGLFVTLIGFWLIARALYFAYYVLGGSTTSWSGLLYTLAQLIGFAFLLYVLKKERQPFSTIWFGGGGLGDLAYAMVFLILAWITWMLLYSLGWFLGFPEVKWWEKWPIATPIDVIPIATFTLSAAFFEEVFYRGYAITRLYSLTGSIALASLASIVFFTLIHYSFGPRVMLCILGWGTIDTLLFLYRRSTKASFYFHLTNNAIVYVLFPLIGIWR